jgi:hypothetical protein
MSAVTLNWKNVIDRPIAQTMSITPVATAAGTCICTDLRGTHRYIYGLFAAAGFYRYDVQTDSWQQLPSPTDAPSFVAGCSMVFDPSRGSEGYVWLFSPKATASWAYFQYYDVALHTWTSRAVPAALAVAWATSASLAHTCSTYAAGGNDDYIYLIGNGAVTWYRYSIVGNSWSSMANNLTAAPGAGCAIWWCYGYSTDLLYVIRGSATTTIYTQSISAPAAWVTVSYLPAFETFGSGSASSYDGSTHIVIQKDATQRTLRFNLAATHTMSVGVTFPYTGTAVEGNKMCHIKSTEATPVTFIYFLMNTGQFMWRVLETW